MQNDGKQGVEQGHSSYITEPQYHAPPAKGFVRAIKILGVLLVVVNIMLMVVPLLLVEVVGFMAVHERYVPIVKQLFFVTFLTGVVMCLIALVLLFLHKRQFVRPLFFWGTVVDALSFCMYTLISLLFTITAKPVIYLYPEIPTDVTVRLDYHGSLIADYPPYDPVLGGWEVTAQPDGILTNHADGQEYSYLFWEGTPATRTDWDLSTGFVVKGSDTREFLQEKLAELGLTPKEYNEFIVYWYPKMKDNTYNLIHFAGTEYTDTAPLTITPPPDSMLRVFMVYKPLTKPVDITPQTFPPFTRTGFTVVEWGGAEV